MHEFLRSGTTTKFIKLTSFLQHTEPYGVSHDPDDGFPWNLDHEPSTSSYFTTNDLYKHTGHYRYSC